MQAPVFWLALFAATGYAVAALLIKAALGRGSRADSLNFFCNLAMGLLLQVLWIFPVEPDWWLHWWKPVICGLLFYLGQCLTFASLARCDVSVATPVLGAKVVFVVLFLSLAGATWPGLRWWIAAGMCSVGILLVSARRGFWRDAGSHASGTLASLGAAACFGLTDALVQLWVPTLGVGAFVPVMFAATAFVTLADQVVRHRLRPAWPLPAARKVALWGLTLLTLQCGVMAVSIGYYQDAAGTNIVYGSRAVLGVLLAGLVAYWTTRRQGITPPEPFLTTGGLFGRRLLGSILVFAAIAIVLF